MKIAKKHTRKFIAPLAGSIVALLLSGNSPAQAGSATWLSSPNNSSWFGLNWVPNTVPTASTDVAAFSTSSITSISLNGSIDISGIVFNAGASAYTITVNGEEGGGSMSFEGAGITNNSSNVQNFEITGSSSMTFNGSSTAGSNTVITIQSSIEGSGTSLIFNSSSSAGEATIIVQGPISEPDPAGNVTFNNTSSAGQATITVQGGTTGGGAAGDVAFFDNSTASQATITVQGAIGGEGSYGTLHFWDSSTAGAATLIADGGTGGGAGGIIYFEDNSTGGTAAVKVYGNGTLDISGNSLGSVTIGSLEGSGLVNLGSNNLTVGSNNVSTVFSGVMQDGGEFGGSGGSLTKIGTGTLVLSGANTYTGSTIINGGTLLVDGSIVSPQTTVNPGGTLGGTGVIGGNVTNSGVVQPGDAPGTLNISGRYTQTASGLLSIRIGGLTATAHDLLAVGGAATLAGTLQLQSVNGFHFTVAGQQVTFLTAAGGVSGVFSTVNNPFNTGTMIGTEVVYSPTSVSIEAYQKSFATLVKSIQSNFPYQTENEAAVAIVLDDVLADLRFAKIIARLDNEPLSKVLNDLNRLGPEELTSIFQIAVSQAEVQTFNLQRRLEDVRWGSNGFSASGFAMNGLAPGYGGPVGDSGLLEGPDGKSGKMALTPSPNNRWGVFVTGTGEFTSVNDTDNARGYDLTSAGFTLGADYRVTDHFVIGLATGYDYSDADLVKNGRVTVNGGKLALYSTAFTGKGLYADLAVQGGYNSYDTTRAAVGREARASTDGGEFNLLLGTGYEWKIGGLTFGPTANFEYSYVGLDGTQEHGSLAPLNLSNQSQDSIRTTLGAKASYECKIGSATFVPELRLGWQHEYGDNPFGIESQFEQGGPDFTVHGPGTGRDSLIVGAGFAIRWNDRVSTYVYYDGELGRANYQSNNVSGGFRIAF